MGTRESVLIEIMCSRTNAQIAELRNVYQQMYNSSLENDLIGETSGHFKRLLVSLCSGGRDESVQTDPLRANQVTYLSISYITAFEILKSEFI